MKEFIVIDKDSNKIIGLEHRTMQGQWMHKWYRNKDNTFEEGSWRGRCTSAEGCESWVRKPFEENTLGVKR